LPGSFSEVQSSSWQQAVSTGIAIKDGGASQEIRPANPGLLYTHIYSLLRQTNTTGDKYTKTPSATSHHTFDS